ncbi:hypothetical protein JOY44_26165 (plasmid) [Phormidium sp. CLA17]|uniref:hypothetical protein n=1 Tax=Leptolyngbya sp. Cla-17 TaxID=2803751 RepID=UPI001492E988|nr:hypothetical protein [Leptolyngbya sp. Cla-17]MBM0745008.1 hypothetical protein [Leptolyngbya sp. Cla-17]
MSHFSDIRTQLNHPQALVKGLQAMGFDVQAVTLTPEMSIKDIQAAEIVYHNSYGDSRRAHVIARQRQLMNNRTAIGFLWDAVANLYTLQCDPYEIRHSQFGREFDYTQLQDAAIKILLNQQLQMEHDRAAVLLKFPANQYTITEQRIENKITLTIKPKQQLQTIGSAI